MLSVLTPAKVNLFLNLRPRRPDGFHEIASIMQAIRLWDRLDVEPREDGLHGLIFSCNVPDLERDEANNLVVKAYHLFWKESGLPPLGLKVHLEKDIPTQAGLGGGSSDAAAMLIVLNHLSHAELSDDRLRRMAAQLGSDVPFFINGGLALAGGRGEIIEPLPPGMTADLPLVIIKPLKLHISTADAYRLYAEAGRYDIQSPDHILSALKAIKQKRGSAHDIRLESYLLNDFERVLPGVYPQLHEMARLMKEAGIQRPLLSGSGSAVIGFAESGVQMRKAVAERFPRNQYEIHWTQTHSGGLVQVETPAAQDSLAIF